MDRKIGFLSFFLLGLLVAVMGWATWDEHVHGSAHTYAAFYNSMWFTVLWIAMATLSSYYVYVNFLHKRLSVFLLHAALLLILAGALATRLAGKTGAVHLRGNERVSFFIDESTREKVHFPFSLSLDSFGIDYYPGTASPSNYVSIISIAEKNGSEPFETEISMNNILKHRGFRFYQASFDEDLKGSVLSVNRDPWGIGLTYIGYYLLFFSMLFVLFDKRERFRLLVKRLARKSALPLVVLAAFSVPAQAGFPLLTGDSLTVSAEQARALGSLWVDYHGRISPVQTLANDFTKKLIGRKHYKGLSGEQVFFGWLFFPERWQYEPLFKIKNEELKRIIAPSGKACFDDFFDDKDLYKLEKYHQDIHRPEPLEGLIKEAAKLDEKIRLIGILQSGNLLKMFPLDNDEGVLHWYAPAMQLPSGADSADIFLARHFLSLYYESIMRNDGESALAHIGELKELQRKIADAALPSGAKLKAERLYNSLDVFSLLFKVCLAFGFSGLLAFIISAGLAIRWPRIETFFYAMLWLTFIAATFGLGLRAYIGGRLPLSNAYETMLLAAWICLLTGIFTHRYSFLITVFSFLLSGFILLAAHIGSMNTQISHLMPVLQSPLLSIHVLVIMVAYGLCGFMALNSIASFFVWVFAPRDPQRTSWIKRMKEISELFMFPACFLLGAGVFIGAIWANVSWGRYWGWDPKEVWALITFLLMSFTFHGKTLTWFHRPMFYHAFVLVIFLAVLMTYFGVNYILGGIHSYAV